MNKEKLCVTIFKENKIEGRSGKWIHLVAMSTPISKEWSLNIIFH